MDKIKVKQHKVLRFKAIKTDKSISAVVRHILTEDSDDLAAFADRANEPTVTYEAMLQGLKCRGKL